MTVGTHEGMAVPAQSMIEVGGTRGVVDTSNVREMRAAARQMQPLRRHGPTAVAEQSDG
jgi:hypothetical protein